MRQLLVAQQFTADFHAVGTGTGDNWQDGNLPTLRVKVVMAVGGGDDDNFSWHSPAPVASTWRYLPLTLDGTGSKEKVTMAKL